jgi:hypothetical protein
MSRKLPTKSSSRAGRFKKKLVPTEVLLIEAPLIEAKLAPVLELHAQKRLSDPELVAIYLIAVLSQRFPGSWPGARTSSSSNSQFMPFKLTELAELLKFEPNVRERLRGVETLSDLFSQFAFRSTPQSVNRSIMEWSRGHYGLELMFHIPTPHEVLLQQKHGRRCVSVLWKKGQASRYILGERDALSFTMHDLIHADHFYRDNHSHQGQLGFYGLLDYCLMQNHFEELLSNEKFKGEFEYVIADMNAYAIHLMKCFKSALIFYHPEKEKFFAAWMEKLNLNPEEHRALEELNQSVYLPEVQDAVILGMLAKWKAPQSAIVSML